ncbi:hypothetical protein B0H14DRAFT_3531086 [Mycena olivaceomarginata]|nr:hypothetical protein B0H14DRAFT_3531086 [Mycena olivaceomarginata]
MVSFPVTTCFPDAAAAHHVTLFLPPLTYPPPSLTCSSFLLIRAQHPSIPDSPHRSTVFGQPHSGVFRALTSAHFVQEPVRSVSPGSEEVESEDATGSDFDPDQKTSSPDSDEEFPSSLPLPTAEAPMDVDEEPESSHRARRPASASSRGKSSPTKATSKTVVRAQSPDESRAERSPMPDDSVKLNLAEHRLPSWALPAHFPKFKIRSDPSNPVPSQHVTFRPYTDVEGDGNVQGSRQVKSRLEDSHPSVFDNPAYKILDMGKWLEHIAHGDTSPKPERPIFVSRPLDLPDPAVGTSSFQEFQKIYNQNAETRARHEADEMARFAQLDTDYQAALEKWEAMANRHRRDIPIIRAEQVEVLRLYRACREDIIDRMEREANTVGEYAYHVASRALSGPANARVTLSRTPVVSSSSVPNPSIPSKRGHEEIDDVPTPPIAAFTSAQSDSDEERSASITRVGPPGKGKAKASAPLPSRGSGVEASNASRVPPGSALSAQTRDVERGVFLGAGVSAAGPSTTDEGTSFAVGGPSSSQQGGAFDIDAWHEAHNPFNQPPFQQDLVLNANGTKAVVSHGWQLDPVNPAFPRAARSLRCPRFPDAFLGGRFSGQGVYRLSQGQERLCSPRLVGRAARHELPAVPRENRTCVASTSGFDFTLTDQVISTMNAELIDLYTNAILSVFTPLTGIDVASRIMSRMIVHRQNARLWEGRAPRADPPNVEVPLERRVDVLVRPGAGRQEFLEQSFVPFQGAQYGDRRHRLPLPDRQSPIDATTYLTHMPRRRCSFGQRISQAFLPERRVVVPEDFEVGDRPLNFGGFLAAGEVRLPPPHPPILPSDAELSEFPSTEASPTDTPMERVTGPLVAGGFDTSEEDSAHEDDSAREDDSAGEAPPWPPARCRRVRGSLPPIDEESRDMTPPRLPRHSLSAAQEPLAALNSILRRSIRRLPRKPVGPPSLVSSVWRISALEMTPLTPSSARRVTSHGISLPPQIVTNPQVLLPPSPVRAASVGAVDAVSFDEFETSEACCVNGASVGSVESGGVVAGSSVQQEAEDGAVPQISLCSASKLPSGGWVEKDFINPPFFVFIGRAEAWTFSFVCSLIRSFRGAPLSISIPLPGLSRRSYVVTTCICFS